MHFCSRFELHDRKLGELHIATEIMRVQDRLDVAQAVACERRNLRNGGVCQRQSDLGRTSQIMERQTFDFGAVAGLAPRRSKAISFP